MQVHPRVQATHAPAWCMPNMPTGMPGWTTSRSDLALMVFRRRMRVLPWQRGANHKPHESYACRSGVVGYCTLEFASEESRNVLIPCRWSVPVRPFSLAT